MAKKEKLVFSDGTIGPASQAHRFYKGDNYPRKGSIYFLQGDTTRRIKIGFSKTPMWRATDIAKECSERINYIGTVPDCSIQDEAKIHRHFAHLRVIGEWFSEHPDLLAFIQEACKETGAIGENTLARALEQKSDARIGR